MMTPKMFELAMVAMMFRAIETLDARTASHLLGNAFAAHSIAADNADRAEWSELPGPVEVLQRRFVADVIILKKNPSYNASYPEREMPGLFVELATIWHSYARGSAVELEPLERLVTEAKRVEGTVALSWSKGSWNATIRTEKKRPEGNHRFVGCAAALAISRSRENNGSSEGT